MDRRGSFVFGVIVSIVLVLVGFFAAYPFIQKSISSTTSLGDGVFDDSGEEGIDGYELFIQDLRSCVDSEKSNCWCNIDYGKLYNSLDDPATGDQVTFFSDGDKLTLHKSSSSVYIPFKGEDSIIDFYGGIFSYGFNYFQYGQTSNPGEVTQVPKIFLDVTKKSIGLDGVKNSKLYRADSILATGITTNSDIQSYPFRKSTGVFNTINANGVLETDVAGIGSRNIYLGEDLFIYKGKDYEYYGLNKEQNFLKDKTSLYGYYYYTSEIVKSIVTKDLKNQKIDVVNYYHHTDGPSLFFVSSDFESKIEYYPLENNGVYANEEYAFKNKDGLDMFGVREVKIHRSDNLCNEASV